MTKGNPMFINSASEDGVNMVIEYKGYFISIFFDSFNHSRGKKLLTRTEMLIVDKNGRNVNHLFFDLRDPLDRLEEDGPVPDNFINDITLDTLAFIKAKIDCQQFQDKLKIEEEVVIEQPRYTHTCDTCVFLGQFEKADLYVCPNKNNNNDIDTVIARFSSTPGDYFSGLEFAFMYGSALDVSEKSDMRFAFEALKRAIHMGFRPAV